MNELEKIPTTDGIYNLIQNTVEKTDKINDTKFVSKEYIDDYLIPRLKVLFDEKTDKINELVDIINTQRTYILDLEKYVINNFSISSNNFSEIKKEYNKSKDKLND